MLLQNWPGLNNWNIIMIHTLMIFLQNLRKIIMPKHYKSLDYLEIASLVQKLRQSKVEGQ